MTIARDTNVDVCGCGCGWVIVEHCITVELQCLLQDEVGVK
jgi:hypothetical protein